MAKYTYLPTYLPTYTQEGISIEKLNKIEAWLKIVECWKLGQLKM